MKPFKNRCPFCGEEQHCPCTNCSDKNADKVAWIWVAGNGPIKCGHCGHEMSLDDWEIEEWNQFEAWRKERGCFGCCHFQQDYGCPILMKCKNFSKWEG